MYNILDSCGETMNTLGAKKKTGKREYNEWLKVFVIAKQHRLNLRSPVLEDMPLRINICLISTHECMMGLKRSYFEDLVLFSRNRVCQ